MTQNISIFQALWGMESQPWRATESWTFTEKLEQAAAAGFAGVAFDMYDEGTNPDPKTVAPQLDALGLRSSVTAFVTDRRPLDEGLDYAVAVGAELVVLCGQVFPPDLDATAELVNGWHARCRDAGIAMHLETHRYTLTNDLPTAAALLPLIPEVELALDLSHYVVAHEFPEPGPEGTEDPRVQVLLNKVIARGGSVQGRVATRGQVQVPIGWSAYRSAEERFARWWTSAFASWKARHEDDADLVFLCELGPFPYAVAGEDGHDASDRFADACALRDRARELFATA